MERHIINAFTGVKKDINRRLLPDNLVGDVKNIIFDNGTSKVRPGYSEYGAPSSGPLGGFPREIISFTTFAGTGYTILITSIGVYCLSAGTWHNITPRHATNSHGGHTGTGSTVSSPADMTFTCSGADWLTTEINTYSAWYIAEDVAGTGDPEQAGLTWYLVAGITSTTELVALAVPAPTWVGADYILRKDFTPLGHSEAVLSTAEKILVFAGGQNSVYYFQDLTNTPTLALLGDLTNPATLAYVTGGNCVAYFNDFTFLGHLRTSAGDSPTDIAWSEQGDPADWTTTDLTSGTVRLPQDGSNIVAMKEFKDRLYIFKANSITEASRSNDAFNPFVFNEDRSPGIGCQAIRTLQIIEGKFFIFLSQKNVYIFDGINIQAIGDPIIDNLLEYTDGTPSADKSFSMVLESYSLYLLFAVGSSYDRCYVFDYKLKTWSIWEFSENIVGAGLSTLGTGTGYTHSLSYDYDDDDGTDIDALIDTSDFDLGDRKIANHIKETTITAGIETSGSVRIRMSPDFGSTWSAWTVVSLVGDSVLFVGSTPENVGSADFNYDISDVQYRKSAVIAGTAFTAADTINTAAAGGSYWGIWLVQVTAAGVISTKSPSADQVYSTEALAVAALPTVTASNAAVGYVTVQSNAGVAWTAQTDDITAASDCLDSNFYNQSIADFQTLTQNWRQRGKQVRVQIENVDGSYFAIEDLVIGFNNAGIKIKR